MKNVVSFEYQSIIIVIKVFGSYRKMPLENLSNIRRLIWKYNYGERS